MLVVRRHHVEEIEVVKSYRGFPNLKNLLISVGISKTSLKWGQIKRYQRVKSSSFIFAWFKHLPFGQQPSPFLLCLSCTSNFGKLKQNEMGIRFILCCRKQIISLCKAS